MRVHWRDLVRGLSVAPASNTSDCRDDPRELITSLDIATHARATTWSWNGRIVRCLAASIEISAGGSRLSTA
ncbi:MAG: hypothetical protein ACI9WU_005027 [Myxococcota bacterium]